MRRTVPIDDWRVILVGWCVLAPAVILGTFPFLRLRQERVYVAVFASALCLASVVMAFVCRALWRQRWPWRRLMVATFGPSYVLGLLSASAAAWAGNRFGVTPPLPFDWGAALGGGLTGCFALAAWSAAYFSVRHTRASEAAQQSARDAELRALRYQISPHFLFNTLNTVSSLVATGQTAAATRMLARLGSFYRSTLEGDGNPDVLLADEIAFAEQYLDIEKIRLGDRLTVELHVAPAALPAHVPHLLLQPLVENAIRHGIAPRTTGGRLVLRIERHGGDVIITLCNDCNEARTDTWGIGLTNTAARLEQFYGRAHELTLRSPNVGEFEVRMRLPFR